MTERGQAFEAVHKAAERGEMTIGGLPQSIEAGSYSAVFAWGAPDNSYTILDLDLEWDGGASFTTIGEMFFDSAYRGWGHWYYGELLFTWTGGPEDFGHSVATLDGVDDEDEERPTQPDWWLQLFSRMMDRIYE